MNMFPKYLQTYGIFMLKYSQKISPYSTFNEKKEEIVCLFFSSAVPKMYQNFKTEACTEPSFLCTITPLQSTVATFTDK